MFWRLAKPILILPGTVLCVIPLVLQWLTAGWPFTPWDFAAKQLALAIALAIPALAVAIKTGAKTLVVLARN